VRIKLEYEDGPVFGTFLAEPAGLYRSMIVKINGKPFVVWAKLETETYYMQDKSRYVEEIDKALIASMERMLTKAFNDACAAVPEGVDMML
jgi:hypothetical protein